MKISDLAEVAGVSVRTIRHYHDIGLLPLPTRHTPWRDYSIEDLERLLIIRTFAEAGVPLSEIPTAPQHGASIDQAVAHIDAHIARLQRQRRRLLALRSNSNHATDSLLPETMTHLYDQVEYELRTSKDAQALELLLRKRRIDELGVRLRLYNPEKYAVYLRDMPPEDIADWYHRFALLGTDQWSEQQCQELVDIVFRILRKHGPLPANILATSRHLVRSRTARILAHTAYPAPGHRRFVDLTFQQFTEYLKEYD